MPPEENKISKVWVSGSYPTSVIFLPCVTDTRCIDSPLHMMELSPIMHLFRGVRPSTVSRFVITSVFFTINSLPLWPYPHVGKEVLKRIQPPLADRYPLRSV